MNVNFPFRIDTTGHVAQATSADHHIAQMIEQVLFTDPGERVMRPSFGCGLLQLVFAPLSTEALHTIESQIHASLQEWLGHRIDVSDVAISTVDGQMGVGVTYTVRSTGSTNTREFSVPATI